ncbi:hypothetical protein GCM10027170_12850 [Aliiglaciecola aliphaticivorans]
MILTNKATELKIKIVSGFENAVICDCWNWFKRANITSDKPISCGIKWKRVLCVTFNSVK